MNDSTICNPVGSLKGDERQHNLQSSEKSKKEMNCVKMEPNASPSVFTSMMVSFSFFSFLSTNSVHFKMEPAYNIQVPINGATIARNQPIANTQLPSFARPIGSVCFCCSCALPAWATVLHWLRLLLIPRGDSGANIQAQVAYIN